MPNGNGLKTIFRTALTQVSDTAIDTLGDIRWDQDGKRYKYVQFSVGSGNVAAVAGNFVGYKSTGGFSVTSDVSDTVSVGAGVLMAAPTDAQYCWIQTGGEATLNTALVSGANGNALTLSTTTDGTLKVAGAVTDAVSAFALNAGAKKVTLVCPA